MDSLIIKASVVLCETMWQFTSRQRKRILFT